MANGHGGKRANTGGSLPGRRWASTITKAEVREATQRYIQQHMPAMLRSQIAHAVGIGHLFKRDDQGKFTRVVDEDEMERLLTEEEEGKSYWIFSKDPSVDAFKELNNRCMDQSPKPVEVTGKDGAPLQVQWLD